jgi:CheY-like chemotaxis protein
MHVFREQTGALLPGRSRNCSRMDGDGCPDGDDEEDSMIKKLRTVPASGRKILLVDDNPKEEHIRAIMLNTHGYDVDSVSNIDDAYRFSQTKHPDLVLLALSKDSDGELTLWERIKRATPRQRVAFLINHSLYLSPVFSMSDLVRKSGQDDFVERIGALFCAT